MAHIDGITETRLFVFIHDMLFFAEKEGSVAILTDLFMEMEEDNLIPTFENMTHYDQVAMARRLEVSTATLKKAFESFEKDNLLIDSICDGYFTPNKDIFSAGEDIDWFKVISKNDTTKLKSIRSKSYDKYKNISRDPLKDLAEAPF